MSGGTPYIGSTISLISKAEIRYEGILWSIDTKDSTVTLANVRSYGTEDRPAEKHVGPRNEVYEYIVFRGSDIKDLHVSKAPKPVNTVNEDPSILQQGAVGSSLSHFPTPASYAATGFGNFGYAEYGAQPVAYSPVPQPGININPGRVGSPMGVPGLIQSRTPSPPMASVPPIGSHARTLESETQTPQPPSQKSTQTGKPRRRSGSGRNSLETNQNGPVKPAEKKQETEEAPKQSSENRAKGAGQRGDSQSGNTRNKKPIKFNSEFDFESSNARFDKEKIELELKSEIEKMKISSQDEEVIVENEVELESPTIDGVYYNKAKSFFDFISEDPLPSEQGKRSASWQEERKLNVETFGVSGSYTRGYGRGRGWRGRGRGRGTDRGYGRGGRYGDRGRGHFVERESGRGEYRDRVNRTNERGGRGGYRGNRGGFRGTWRNNSSSNDYGNQSNNRSRVKNEPSDSSS